MHANAPLTHVRKRMSCWTAFLARDSMNAPVLQDMIEDQSRLLEKCARSLHKGVILMQRAILLSIGIMTALTSLALGQDNMSSEIAPGKTLRVGMIAITVLGGVGDPVARFFGSKLAVTIEPVMYPNPGSYAQSFGKNEWDV